MSPQSGDYTITLSADYGVMLSINGVVVINAVPMTLGATSATVTLTAGQYNPITLTYYHTRDNAYMNAMWSGPGLASAGEVLGPSYLYYSREILGSPLTVESYPGPVAAVTTTATGNGLTNCVSMQSCAFEVQARDAMGNTLFNNGGVTWNISVVGTGDWAGLYGYGGRVVDDIVYFGGVEYVPPSVTPDPGSWVHIGSGNITQGANYVIVVNMSSFDPVRRGDTILVGKETMMVADFVDTSRAYTAGTLLGSYGSVTTLQYTVIPLSRPYLGASLIHTTVYKLLNCTTGKYAVTYTPKIRGNYLIHVQTMSINEIQQVQFYTVGSGTLTGNYTLSITTTDITTGRNVQGTTRALQLGSTPSTVTQITAALNALTNLGGVTVTLDPVYGCGTTTCIYTITYLRMNANLPLITVDATFVEGNELLVEVMEVQAGQAAAEIAQSPFALTVMPNTTSAAYSEAYGQGLTQGTTGATSVFSIQAKDAQGNNKYDSQGSDTFRVHAFLPQLDYDTPFSSVDGSPVVTLGTGDGSYNASFTPILSGQYTVAVMLATQFEVQNITADVSARAGSFVLQYGACRLGQPAPGCVTTHRLAWNVDDVGMAAALSALPGIGMVNVTYTRTTDYRTAAWAVTFLDACDKEPLIVVDSSVPALTVVTTSSGMCSMVGGIPTDTTKHQDFPYTNPVMVGEKQLVASTCYVTTNPSCAVTWTFRGQTTASLLFNAAPAAVQAALQALDSVGSVTVNSTSTVIATGTTVMYTVSFLPWQGSTLGHLENYGDLPLLQMTGSDSFATNSTELVAGQAPFTSALVAATTVTAATTTARLVDC